MPCLAYLARVREAYPAVTALGARLVAVGTGSEAQAGELAARGLPFPCLVDATGALYEALGLGRVGWRTALDPATYASYWRAWRAGADDRGLPAGGRGPGRAARAGGRRTPGAVATNYTDAPSVVLDPRLKTTRSPRCGVHPAGG